MNEWVGTPLILRCQDVSTDNKAMSNQLSLKRSAGEVSLLREVGQSVKRHIGGIVHFVSQRYGVKVAKRDKQKRQTCCTARPEAIASCTSSSILCTKPVVCSAVSLRQRCLLRKTRFIALRRCHNDISFDESAWKAQILASSSSTILRLSKMDARIHKGSRMKSTVSLEKYRASRIQSTSISGINF